jgi:hypothetical protein
MESGIMFIKVTSTSAGTVLIPVHRISLITQSFSHEGVNSCIQLASGKQVCCSESLDDIFDQVEGTSKEDTDVASTAITALRKSDNLLRDFFHTMSPDNKLTERIRVQLRDNCLVFQKGKSYEKL